MVTRRQNSASSVVGLIFITDMTAVKSIMYAICHKKPEPLLAKAGLILSLIKCSIPVDLALETPHTKVSKVSDRN